MLDLKISVIGLGYIGLPFSMILAKNGFKVSGYDVDKKKLKKLKSKKYLFEEKNLNNLIKNQKVLQNLSFTNKLKLANLYILCLPTPLNKKNNCDYQYIYKALKEISKVIKDKDKIILESTVEIGFTDKIKKILEIKKKKLKIDIYYVSEKAIPGNTLYEMIYSDRIIGSNIGNKEFIFKLYKSFVKGNIFITNNKEAEATKLIENTYRDFNIGLATNLSQILKKKNVDYKKVFNLSNRHPRVNILSPLFGVGGHCIPIDPFFLENKKSGLISKIRKINNGYIDVISKKINFFIKNNESKKICFWGFGYKLNTNDTRESPPLKIYNKVRKSNCFASDFNEILKIRSFLKSDSALKKCDLHLIFNLNDSYINRKFKNKKYVKALDLIN